MQLEKPSNGQDQRPVFRRNSWQTEKNVHKRIKRALHKQSQIGDVFNILDMCITFSLSKFFITCTNVGLQMYNSSIP